jgi:hypothetical protein
MNMANRSVSNREFKKIKVSNQEVPNNKKFVPVTGIVTLPAKEAKEAKEATVVATEAKEATVVATEAKEATVVATEAKEATVVATEAKEATAIAEESLEALLKKLEALGENNPEAKGMYPMFASAPKNDITRKAVKTMLAGFEAEVKAEEPRKWEALTRDLEAWVKAQLSDKGLSLNNRYIVINESGVSNTIGSPTKARTGGGNRLGFVSKVGKPIYNSESLTDVHSATGLAKKLGFLTTGYQTTVQAFEDHGYKVNQRDGVFEVTGVAGTTVKTKKGENYVIPS